METKMVHAKKKLMYVENNMDSEVKVTSCSKDKRKKHFRWNAFMIDYMSTYKSQMAFIRFGIRF